MGGAGGDRGERGADRVRGGGDGCANAIACAAFGFICDRSGRHPNSDADFDSDSQLATIYTHASGDAHLNAGSNAKPNKSLCHTS
jgi:hypothetical protein